MKSNRSIWAWMLFLPAILLLGVSCNRRELPCRTCPESAPTATATPTVFRPYNWEVTGNETLVGGTYNFGTIHVHPTGSILISDAVTLDLTGDFILDAQGSVGGALQDYYPITDGGPGSGAGGGGAGHGGLGGNDGSGVGGGTVYDSAVSPSLPGSRGAAGSTGMSAQGGGCLVINAPMGQVVINGNLRMDGGGGAAATGAGQTAAGGGSGGTLVINAESLTGHGATNLISATGGAGGNSTGSLGMGGGGGGGGRVRYCVTVLYDMDNAIDVRGGAGGTGAGSNGSAGQDGTATTCP